MKGACPGRAKSKGADAGLLAHSDGHVPRSWPKTDTIKTTSRRLWRGARYRLENGAVHGWTFLSPLLPGAFAMMQDQLRLPLCAAAFCLAVISGGLEASATEVYPGCPVPPTTFNQIWYIDPVKGKTAAAGGLGTQAAPWNSLQAAFSVQPGYTTPLLSSAPLPAPEPGQSRQRFLPWRGSDPTRR